MRRSACGIKRSVLRPSATAGDAVKRATSAASRIPLRIKYLIAGLLTKGLVDGVPTTIKDIVLTKGWPTLRGSLLSKRDQPWNEDAPAVARLREHGAVFLGKTTTPEFGWKALGDSPLTGITRNPWSLAH